ncbi:MAG: membrane dipeptidase [Trueperaceae bacterium]|nr:membrane dipeptidase [Trueperaceae bacterium]
MSLPTLRPNKGFHDLLDREHPYIFVDACMQAWPDTDYAVAHRHGATCYAPTACGVFQDLDEALENIMSYHLAVRQHSNVRIAKTAADIRAAKADGVAALILHAQGGEWLGGKLHRLAAFKELGLRMMLPAYNRANLLCSGCLEPHDGGLTSLGRAFVAEANRLGVLLDGSHVGYRSCHEMIDASSAPVVFTHSNVKALVDSPRNIPDDLILACVAGGGIIGLAPFGPLCFREGSNSWPTLSDFMDHVDHVVQLTGSTRSIGIGTDMSLGTYIDLTPDPWAAPNYLSMGTEYTKHVSGDRRSPKRALADFNSYAHIWSLIDALNGRGYSDDDVAGILGGNFLRVFEEVWGA